MRSRTLAAALCTISALLAFAPVAHARSKAAPTAPGTYKEWGPDIDKMEIVKPFKIADYDRIVVVPFDTASVELPKQDEKSYPTVKGVLDHYTETFVVAFQKELKAPAKVEIVEKPARAVKTLIVRGKVEELSPGSRAGRMLVGYGTGGSGTKLSGEIVDANSRTVLARFTQARRSGGTFKFGGGNDERVMQDAIHAEGQDVAHILDAF